MLLQLSGLMGVCVTHAAAVSGGDVAPVTPGGLTQAASSVSSPSAPSPSTSSSSTSSSCVNSPDTRSCWSDGFDLDTNYYEYVPDTNVTREYWFDIQNTTASPDGVELPVMLINGSLPGPTIIADWGDWVGTFTYLM